VVTYISAGSCGGGGCGGDVNATTTTMTTARCVRGRYFNGLVAGR